MIPRFDVRPDWPLRPQPRDSSTPPAFRMATRRWLSIAGMALLASCGGGAKTPAATAAATTTTTATIAPATPAAPAGPVAPVITSDGTVYGDLRATGAKLMLHQRGTAAVTPANFASRLGTMETTLVAYSGAFVRLPVTSTLITRNAPVSLAAITADLAPMASLQPTRLKLNFAIVEWQRDLDPFDDWSVVIANFTNLAKAAKAAGLVGVVIDNEASLISDDGATGLRVNYPADVRFASTHSVYEYRARTQLISKQIMQAMLVEFPRLAVVVLRGPSATELLTPPQLTPPLGYGQPALLGSFFTGFVEAKTDAAMVIDGGDDYGLRRDEEFVASVAWRKSGLAAVTNSPFMPQAMRPIWPTAVSAAFGLRETDGYFGQTAIANITPVWENSVTMALRNADAFVWTSFDSTDMTLAAASNAFVQATVRAKAAALSSTARLATAALGTGTGLLAEYFDSPDRIFLMQTRIDPVVDYSWGGGPAGTVIVPRNDDYAVIWSGYVEAPTTGTYTIFGSTDDGMRITVNSVVMVNSLVNQGQTEYSDTVLLTAGQRYPVKVEWYQHNGGAEAHMSWLPPGGVKQIIPTSRLYPGN